MGQPQVWLGTSDAPAAELLVHFYLPPGSHEIDAYLLNKCEAEFLLLLKEIGRQLDVSFEVEVQAYAEGGFSVMLKLIKANAVALTLIGGAIVGICGGADWYLYKAPLQQQQIDKNKFELERDKLLADQQYAQNELNLKKARIELKKLEQEASQAAPTMPATEASKSLPLEPPPKPEDVIPALVGQRKIVRHRSKFYELLLEYDRVSKVGFAQAHFPLQDQEVVVTRQQFVNYVVTLDALPPSSLTMAQMEIVSPVLRRGNYKWRGILGKKVIPFEILDDDFLTKVANRKIKFQSGTTLICDIEVQPKEDEAGEVASSSYTVVRVHRHYNKDVPTMVSDRLRTPVQDVKLVAPNFGAEQIDLELPEEE